MRFKFIGWTRSRDRKGEVTKYHLKDYCNCITSFVSRGGQKRPITRMGNTVPYVLLEYEQE